MQKLILTSKYFSSVALKRCSKCQPKSLPLGSIYFWFGLIQLNRSYKYDGKFARTVISTLNGHISKPVALCEKLKKINCNYFSVLGHVGGSEIFHAAFLAHMGLSSVIFWVLEVGHRGPFLPKYAPGSGKGWEKKKIYCNIKNEHVTVTFVNQIFRNFA